MKTPNNFNTTLLSLINFKKLFSFIALICFTQIGLGQGLEDFANCTVGSSYSDSSFSGNDGITWTYIASRDEDNTTGVTVPGLMLRRVSDGSKVTSSTISGGIGNFSVKLYKGFTGGGDRQVELFVNGVSQGTSTPFDNYDEQIFMVSGINQPGDVIIELRNTTAKQVIVDDIEWTAFSGSVPPGITLGAVSGNTSEDGTTATFTAVLNAAPASDVVLNVTSGDTGEVTVTPSQLTFTSSNWDTSQTITVSGVDDATEDGNQDVAITVAIDDTLSDDSYDGLSETIIVTNEDDDFPNIVITEFMYNTPGTDDEWIELYNNNGSDVDISSWTLNVGSSTFTFPPSTNFSNNTYITIAMGSNGDGTFNNDNPFTPDYSNVSDPVESTNDTNNMSNSAAIITLENIASTIIDTVAYDDGDVSSTGGSGPSYEIIDTTADNSSTASNWQASAFNGGSPGKLSSTSWTGATDTNWDTSTNWTNGLATSTKDILIPNGLSTYPIATGNVTINSSASLTIAEEASLQVSGDFTNNGTVTLNSTEDDFSSLIVTGTATGDIVYNRYVNSYNTNALGGGWDLVGAPVGMTIADFITANGANIEVLGTDYAFSQYDNALGQWVRYQTASQTGSFTTGQGYSMATNAGDGATVAFTGAMKTISQSINIINNNDANGGAGRRWNLVSNPFPSYINGNSNAAAVNNFMDVNSGVIDGSFLGVYGWNGSSYTTYNNTSDAFSIAPGQAFWVAALNTTDTALNFTAAMRTTTGTGDFVLGPQPLVHKLELKLFNGNTEKAATKFYFRDGLSLDLDPGYDAGAFNQSTKLSTRLPQGSQEFAFEINAMGIDAMQNTRVPLEIKQNAGQAFTISIADMELPEDIYVYLEDTLNGTLTSLKDQDFELVAQSNLSGADRFFIVFKSNSVLSSGDTLCIDALNVYKANTDSFVTIAGISSALGQLNATIFNILGMTVREKALNPATATQTISTDGLSSGLYIIQLRSGNQVFTKKVIVQ
jgi:hypothetical protein